MFTRTSISGISLDAAGLIALADIRAIVDRTILTGGASYLDTLFLAPGIHCQRHADEFNADESPVTASLVNNFVFRVENQAVVSFLQSVSEPGRLTLVKVSEEKSRNHWLLMELLYDSKLTALLYLTGVALTVIAVVLFAVIHDWWALGVTGMLILARAINAVVIRRRVSSPNRKGQRGWKGTMEEHSYDQDLLVLLNHDRWIRMQGKVNDIRTVTAGEWLRDENAVESIAASFATLLVYSSATLAGNASTVGSLLIACHLLISVGILAVCNSATDRSRILGRELTVEWRSAPEEHMRRKDMAISLLKEVETREWAVKLDLLSRSDVDRIRTEKDMENGAYMSDHIKLDSNVIEKT